MSQLGYLVYSFQGLGTDSGGLLFEVVSSSAVGEDIIIVFLLETYNMVTPPFVLNGNDWFFDLEHLKCVAPKVCREDLLIVLGIRTASNNKFLKKAAGYFYRECKDWEGLRQLMVIKDKVNTLFFEIIIEVGSSFDVLKKQAGSASCVRFLVEIVLTKIVVALQVFDGMTVRANDLLAASILFLVGVIIDYGFAYKSLICLSCVFAKRGINEENGNLISFNQAPLAVSEDFFIRIGTDCEGLRSFLIIEDKVSTLFFGFIRGVGSFVELKKQAGEPRVKFNATANKPEEDVCVVLDNGLAGCHDNVYLANIGKAHQVFDGMSDRSSALIADLLLILVVKFIDYGAESLYCLRGVFNVSYKAQLDYVVEGDTVLIKKAKNRETKEFAALVSWMEWRISAYAQNWGEVLVSVAIENYSLHNCFGFELAIVSEIALTSFVGSLSVAKLCLRDYGNTTGQIVFSAMCVINGGGIGTDLDAETKNSRMEFYVAWSVASRGIQVGAECSGRKIKIGSSDWCNLVVTCVSLARSAPSRRVWIDTLCLQGVWSVLSADVVSLCERYGLSFHLRMAGTISVLVLSLFCR